MSLYGGSVSGARAFWDVGHEPGRGLIALGFAVALTAVAIDVFLVGQLSLFFDLTFVTLCLGLATLVRTSDFFVVALLPPAILLGVFILVAAVAPHAMADSGDSFVQALISGLVRHSWALLVGFALCLGWLGIRIRTDDSDD
jgi:hypothetical protein